MTPQEVHRLGRFERSHDLMRRAATGRVSIATWPRSAATPTTHTSPGSGSRSRAARRRPGGAKSSPSFKPRRMPARTVGPRRPRSHHDRSQHRQALAHPVRARRRRDDRVARARSASPSTRPTATRPTPRSCTTPSGCGRAAAGSCSGRERADGVVQGTGPGGVPRHGRPRRRLRPGRRGRRYGGTADGRPGLRRPGRQRPRPRGQPLVVRELPAPDWPAHAAAARPRALRH